MDAEPLRCCVVGCCLSQAVRVTLLASQKSFLSDMCGVLYWQSLEENGSSMLKIQSLYKKNQSKLEEYSVSVAAGLHP